MLTLGTWRNFVLKTLRQECVYGVVWGLSKQTSWFLAAQAVIYNGNQWVHWVSKAKLRIWQYQQLVSAFIIILKVFSSCASVQYRTLATYMLQTCRKRVKQVCTQIKYEWQVIPCHIQYLTPHNQCNVWREGSVEYWQIHIMAFQHSCWMFFLWHDIKHENQIMILVAA